MSYDIRKISNIFSDQELENFLYTADRSEKEIDAHLGRERSIILDSSQYPLYKLDAIVEQVYGSKLDFNGATYVKYSNEFGVPTLPPHFDGDSTELIINFQLSSNTSWDIGLGMDLYALEDNSALIFHPNEVAHWRPRKKFADGEFVKMMFFRYNAFIKKDYTHMSNGSNYKIIDDIYKIIESS